ncbi:N-acetylmuramoyl-L-alanine amidase [Metabacillus fastidiosus]|uniref:N-acetylmuramoyl-L-alanine amidase n=1 Tax=Metabacillus fastidiosus TaxID=1458 RepID=UPI002E1F9140|nr:N-acetylmuramoyl-L-alanine amidase [Metabacillus fastidiosus]
MFNNMVISSGHSLLVRGAADLIDEVNEARRVTNRVIDYLKELSCSVCVFHDDNSRTQRDNINTIVKHHNSQQRDLDVSVHFNAASKTDSPRGVEVLYVNDNYRSLADKVSKAIADASGLINRGAKKRTNLGFLNGTNKPAILIEVCFVDSKADVQIYNSKFDEICLAIAESLSGKKVEKGSVQEVKKFEVSDATKNAIKNLSQYGIVAENFEVKDSNQAMLISIANNMVKAIKDGKLPVKY